MSLLIRIYFNALFGALGGLAGWLLFGIFIERNRAGDDLWLLGGGAFIGGSIGYLIVGGEALRDLSLVRFCRLASYGLVLGALGGAVGMILGDRVNFSLNRWLGSPLEGSARHLLGMMLARGLGWMFLGLAIGVCEGIAARSLGKLSYGGIGGTLGGLLGGALFGLFYGLAVRSTSGDTGQHVGLFWGAIGMTILGAAIGALSALVQGVFQPASLRVLRGWQEGREYALDKESTLLGRDEHADIAIFRDMKVEKRHVIIQRVGPRYILNNNNAPPEQTRVNGAPVQRSQELADGDRIELGRVVLRFQLRSAQNRKKVSSGSQGS